MELPVSLHRRVTRIREQPRDDPGGERRFVAVFETETPNAARELLFEKRILQREHRLGPSQPSTLRAVCSGDELLNLHAIRDEKTLEPAGLFDDPALLAPYR